MEIICLALPLLLITIVVDCHIGNGRRLLTAIKSMSCDRFNRDNHLLFACDHGFVRFGPIMGIVAITADESGLCDHGDRLLWLPQCMLEWGST